MKRTTGQEMNLQLANQNEETFQEDTEDINREEARPHPNPNSRTITRV